MSFNKSSNSSPPSSENQRRVVELAELAGGLAHELRNPLSTMMVNLKLLAEDLQDDTVGEADVRRRSLLKVDTLRREAERLQQLFDDFLNLAGPVTLKREPVDVRRLLDRLATFLEPLANSKGVQLTVVPPESAAMCLGDESLLSQALLNLAINGQQAMPDGGDLRLAGGACDGEVWMTVSDTGVGIATADQERIFKPFFSTKEKGTGLGLAIVNRIVHEHGGTLTLSSEPGAGTTFTLRLPAATSPDSTARG